MTGLRVRIKRVYDAPDPTDGYRILIDRLWPRGVSRERAEVDEWRRDLAPSPALRSWFGHDPARFPEFRERYRAELAANPALEPLREEIRGRRATTLVYAARDARHNHALVLRELLEEAPA